MRGSPNCHTGLAAAAVTRNAVPDRYGGNFDKRKGRASGPSFSLIIIILFALHGRRQGHIAVDLLSIPEDGQIHSIPHMDRAAEIQQLPVVADGLAVRR